MTTAPAMFCPRCNKPSGDTDKCTTCGTRLKTLESAKRRGWVVFGAGVFLVVFVSAIWIGSIASSPVRPLPDSPASSDGSASCSC